VSEIGAFVMWVRLLKGEAKAGAGAEYLNGLKYSEPDSLEVASLESCHIDIDPGITVAMKLDWKLKTRVIILQDDMVEMGRVAKEVPGE